MRVRSTDQGGLYFEKAFTITINDLNEPPTNITMSASAIDENVAANSTVGTLSTTDPDAGNTFTYSLVSGTGSTDNAAFNISGNDLQIAVSPDFETKSSYSVRVRSTDQGGLYFEKAFTITINNLNEPPTNIALSASAIDENVAPNSTVGTLSTTDPDAGNTFTYSLVTGTGDTDNAAFNISGNDLQIAVSPDFETKSSYSVRIRTTDQGGLYFEKAFTITINNLNEPPTNIALSASAIDENVAANSTVGTLSTTDPDAGNTFTYSLVSGTGSTDNAAFNISGSSLRISASPDFETKSSYNVRIRSTDQGGLYYEKEFTITINDLNDVAPVITAGQNFSIDENLANGTSVGTLVATDGDVTPTTFQGWTIVSGNTGNAFAINPSTGEITVANSAALDRETIDAFTLMVTVTDGVNTSAQQSVTISLNDLNDVVPVIAANQLFPVAEFAANGTVVGTISATDGDVTPTTFQNWTIVSGNTDGAFSLDASTGELTVANSAALDHNTNPIFSLSVSVSDGVNTSAAQTVTVTVGNLNVTAPVITADQSFAIDENSSNGTVVGTVQATDADPVPTTLQDWTITGGNTNNAFGIDASTGEITVTNTAALNRETTAEFTLTLTVSDGLNTSNPQTVTVTLNDVNDVAPVVTPNQSFSIDENSPSGTVIGTVVATDGDVTPTTFQNWTISTNADPNGNTIQAFSIDPATGELAVNDPLDLVYETTPDFTIYVTVSDGVNTSLPEAVSIHLNNTTGIEEVTNGYVKAYPNPAIDNLFVESTVGNTISIVTLSGKTIYNGIIESTITTIDVSRFKQGMYILKISGEKGTSTRKIVVE